MIADPEQNGLPKRISSSAVAGNNSPSSAVAGTQMRNARAKVDEERRENSADMMLLKKETR